MSQHSVIARRPHPTDERLVKVFCPDCGRDTEHALFEDEFHKGRHSIFCARWGCDALLHVRLPA